MTFVIVYKAHGANHSIQTEDEWLNQTLKDNNSTFAVANEYIILDTPERLFIYIDQEKQIRFNYSLWCHDPNGYFVFNIWINSERLMSILSNATYFASCEIYPNSQRNITDNYNVGNNISKAEGVLTIAIRGNVIGMENLQVHAIFYTSEGNQTHHTLNEKFVVSILRSMRAIDVVFRYVIMVFIIIITMGFGCKLDLGIVRECIKKPIAPGIGFCCQYLVMPLLGFGIAKLTPIADDTIALGIFICGVCPGGGSSNIYTYLLDGDVSLSITMTFISTLASIGMMPFWIYTLGRLFYIGNARINIPYLGLLQIVATVTVPLVIGALIKYKFIKVALKIMQILKPVTIVFIIAVMSIGIISNIALFRMFQPMHLIVGCTLPYLGYILGGAIAAIFRQPWPRVKTIALETGMQNIGIAYLLMVTSFPPPVGEMASLAPMASGILTPFPPFVIVISRLIYKKCCGQYKLVSDVDVDLTVNGNKDHEKETDEMNVEKLSTV